MNPNNSSNSRSAKNAKNTEQKKILRIMKELNLSEAQVRTRLGLKSSPPQEIVILTLEQAKRIFMTTSSDSPEGKLALRKWKEFALKRAEEASSFAEAYKAYHDAPSHSSASRLAMRKWREYALKRAEDASSFAEARDAFIAAPEGSPAEKLALEKMIQLASSFDEIKLADDTACTTGYCSLRKQIFQRMFELA